MTRSRAVVFDCDGLLVDTAAHWARAFRAAAREHGIPIEPAHLADLRGSAIETAARRFAALGRTDATGPIARTIHARLVGELNDRPPQPMPGASRIVSMLSSSTAVAVASNAPADVLSLSLNAAGLLQAFDVVVGAQPPLRPKPAPDLYLHACSALGVPPGSATALEDSATGARSASAAGLQVVAVTRERWPDTAEPPIALHVPALDDPMLLAIF